MLDDYRWRPAGPLFLAQNHPNPSSSSSYRVLLVLLILLLGALGFYCLVGWASVRDAKGVAPAMDFDASINSLADPPPDDWLLNLPRFEYRLNSAKLCRQPVYFLALIHSKPEHFRQRQVIRQTWASHTVDLIQPVFLLGTVRPEVSLDVQQLIQAEHSKFGDVVQGNFVDHYHNLTIKSLMGLKWAAKYCPSTRFILKSDDDAFVDVVQLKQFIERTWTSGPPQDTLICSVHEAAKVQRTGKWAVETSDYAASTYPTFCSGLAYVMRPQLGRKLLQASQSALIPNLWIDDVYVTGLLADAVQARHFYLNLRYTHQQSDVVEWLKDADARVFPYIVSELDTSRPEWRDLAERLWNRTRPK